MAARRLGEPIAVSDVMQYASLSAYRQAFAEEAIRAVAFIPLVATGGLIGKFMLYYNEPHAFQTDELRVAQAVAWHRRKGPPAWSTAGAVRPRSG